MKPRYFDQIDRDTGEVLDGFVAVLQPKKINAFGKDWLAMSQHALMEIAKTDLGDEARKMLFAVLSKLDFQNFILLNQSELGGELNMKRANVSRAIKRLVDHGILLKGPKVGRSSTFRLNPEYGWKGSAKEHHSAVSSHRKNIEKRMKNAGFDVIKGGKLGTEEEQTQLDI